MPINEDYQLHDSIPKDKYNFIYENFLTIR